MSFPAKFLAKVADKTKNQQVQGIEGVAEILEGLAVVALLALVCPDGNEGKEGKALFREEEFQSEQGDMVIQTAHHPHVDIPQENQLSQIAPPSPSPEEIEH